MKKLTKIISAISVFIMIISSFGLSSFAKSINPNALTEEEIIYNTIYEYTKLKYEIMSDLCYDNEIEDFMSDKCEEDNILKIIVAHRTMQYTNLTFNKDDITISINDLNVKFDNENNCYNVDYLDHVKYMFNIESNGIYSEEINEHHMILDSDYKIINDSYDDSFKEEYESLRDSGESVELVSSEILANSRLRVEQTKQIINSNISSILNGEDIKEKVVAPIDSPNASFSRHAYNRDKATSYALTYALKPNSNYMNMESAGGNCTNFTSQCLKAGGIKHDYTGNYTWYYDSSSKRTASWSYANDFRKYYKNNVGSGSVKGLKAKTCKFSETRQGDLIQRVVNGSAGHTMFIDGCLVDKWGFDDPWRYKYDVYICQNSTSSSSRQKHVLFSSKNIPAAQTEYVHIDSCYY